MSATTVVGVPIVEPEPTDPSVMQATPSVTLERPISDQLLKQREDMRGRIALLLIGSLLFIILAGFAPIWFGWGDPQAVNELLDTFFTPVLTLVGTVAGFYFGEKVAEDRQSSQTSGTGRRGGNSPVQ